jgi:hypothetical protein
MSPTRTAMVYVSEKYIPLFDIRDSFSYSDTYTLYKHRMSLTRDLVAGDWFGVPKNRHKLPCAN